MQIEIVSDNAYARRVVVTVPAADVRVALDRAMNQAARNARLPGFRQGKVPRKVIERRFGPSIREDVAGDLVQQGWTSALTEHALSPVSQPSLVERDDLTADGDFSFTIGVEVRPEIEVDTYTGLEVYQPVFEVTDEQLDRALEARRQREARMAAVTDRAVEEGDTVQIEVVGKDGDDVAFQEPGTLVRTAGDPWLAGIEGLLVGKGVDDTFSGEVTFSEEAKNEDVAGRTLAVEGKVIGIQAMVAPELDDALAEELGHDDLAAFRAAVKVELEAGREDLARNQARANLLEKLIEANPFDVPQGMIDQNLRMLEHEVKVQKAYQGIDPDKVTFTPAKMADLRARALFAARGGLLLEAVVRKEDLELTDDDIDAKLQAMADERGQSVEAIKGWFERDGAMDELRDRVMEEKVLDWLLDRAEITHEAPEPAEAPEPEASEPAAAPPEAKAEAEAAASEPAKKKGGSKYKTISGVRYARDLLEQAEEAGDTVDLATMKAIVQAAQDGKGITDVEKRTIAYIRDEMTVADDAKAWLAEAVDLD